MPRSGSGIYTQPFPNVIEDTTIESAVYNGFTRDVESDLNLPRPVVAGGTGATSPAGALDNLGALPLTGGSLTGALEITTGDLTLNNGSITATDDNAVLTLAKKLSGQVSAVVGRLLDKNRWRLLLGNATPETGGNTGSDFAIERYDDAGVSLGASFTINRRLGTVTVSGPGEGATPAQPLLAINKTLNGTAAVLQGQYNGVARWGFSLGDSTVESGGNSGSRFSHQSLQRCRHLDQCAVRYFSRYRHAFFSRAPADQEPVMVINKISGSRQQSAMIQGRMGNVTRWGMALGDGTPESGGNDGSHFKINRYDDSGTFIDFSVIVAAGQRAVCRHRRCAEAGRRILERAIGCAHQDGAGGLCAGARGGPATAARGLSVQGQRRSVFRRSAGGRPEGQACQGQADSGSMQYAAAKEGREFIGLVAQDAEVAMPELVRQVPGEIDGVTGRRLSRHGHVAAHVRPGERGEGTGGAGRGAGGGKDVNLHGDDRGDADDRDPAI